MAYICIDLNKLQLRSKIKGFQDRRLSDSTSNPENCLHTSYNQVNNSSIQNADNSLLDCWKCEWVNNDKYLKVIQSMAEEIETLQSMLSTLSIEVSISKTHWLVQHL